jgi:hypothetical protein
MPKWANTGPDVMNTITTAKHAILFFIGSSFFFAEGKKKATSFWRLQNAQPAWLR